jgi:hypothetical protein
MLFAPTYTSDPVQRAQWLAWAGEQVARFPAMCRADLAEWHETNAARRAKCEREHPKAHERMMFRFDERLDEILMHEPRGIAPAAAAMVAG